MIDTHCHIDLYEHPQQVCDISEKLGIITIGMTNLPSHFIVGQKHVIKYKFIRLALGFHPLMIADNYHELPLFLKQIDQTSYIGEIGLDFSAEGITSKEIQIEILEKILAQLQNKKKIISVHSRRAEKVLLDLLIKYKIENVIFHWYSGSIPLIEKIISFGYYFSINPKMTISKNGKEIISKIPINRLLTETDGPFVEIDKKIIKPENIQFTINYLADLHNLSFLTMENTIKQNFYDLINRLK